jgi:nitrogen fixation protein FixH
MIANDSVCQRPLTGRTVLICLIAFFGVISIVNGIMIRAAISTFGGLETGSAFQAGQTFKYEIEAARAQEFRHWQVKANVRRADGGTVVEIDARDESGRPLAGLEAVASLHRPTDRRGDVGIRLSEEGVGQFRGTGPSAIGQWDLLIDLSRNGERLFRSRNRVILN